MLAVLGMMALKSKKKKQETHTIIWCTKESKKKAKGKQRWLRWGGGGVGGGSLKQVTNKRLLV